MEKFIAFVHNIKSLEQITTKDKNTVFYPLNLDVYAYLRKNDYFIIEPNISNCSLLKCISKLKECEIKIKKDISFNENLNKYEQETFLNLFHVSASSGLHLYYELKNFKKILIFKNNEWIKTENIFYAHKILFEENIQYLIKILSLNNCKPYFNFFIKIINLFLLKLSDKNQSIWTTTENYGFDYIHSQLLKKNKNLKIYNLLPSTKWSAFNSLKSFLFNNILNFRKNFYNIILINDHNKINDKKISFILKNNSEKILYNIYESLSQFISRGIYNTVSKFNYSNQLIKQNKPIEIYVHHLRWFEPIALAYASNLNSVPLTLISHGSTPISNQPSAFYILSKLASGMSYSIFANKTVSHSPISDDIIHIIEPRLQKIKINFWKLSNNFNNIEIKKKSSSKIILHAGTSKNYATRLWIYESTFEYIKGLLKLIYFVSKIENVKLIIRLRSDIVSSVENIRSLLPNNKNVIYKSSGNFHEDLINSDLLITHFSTTTEQAINLKIPVLLYGGIDRYNHIDGSIKPPNNQISFPVYLSKDQNLKNFIWKILKYHDNNNISKHQYKKLIWDENKNNLKELIEINKNNDL